MSINKKEVNIKSTSVDYTKYVNLDYNVSVLPESFEIKITGTDSEGQNSVILWHHLDLDVLKSHNGWTDNSLWCFPTTLASYQDSDSATVATKYDMIDIFAATLVSKSSPLTSRVGDNPLYQIFVPSMTGDFTTFKIILTVLPEKSLNNGYTISGPSKDIFEDTETSLLSLITPITLTSEQTSVTQNSSVKVNITTAPDISEIWLEPVYGILNKTRVKIVNGSGSFGILSDGLEVGEEIRVKAGFRKFSGVAEFSMTIS